MPNPSRRQGDQIPSIDLRVPEKADADVEDREESQQTEVTHREAHRREWDASRQTRMGLSSSTKRQGGKFGTPRRWPAERNPDR